GSTATMCGLKSDGRAVILRRLAKTRKNWSHFQRGVIMVTGQFGLEVLLRVTHSVPIGLNSVSDPVGGGQIESLARKGGDATGFITFDYALAAKWAELLKEIAPTVTRVAVLRDSAIAAGIGQFAVIQSVALSIGVDVSVINLSRTSRDLRAPQMAV